MVLPFWRKENKKLVLIRIIGSGNIFIPGYGSQGASAANCVRFCKPDGTGALINASRSIIYAYERPEYKSQFGGDWKRCIEQAVIDAKVELANAMQTLI